MTAFAYCKDAFFVEPAHQNFTEKTGALLGTDPTTWKVSKSFATALAVEPQDRQSATLHTFVQQCVQKGIEKPDTLPCVWRFLHSSFEDSDLQAAISHSLGENHPHKQELPHWEQYKTKLQGNPVSCQTTSRWSTFSIPLISSLLETFWSAIDDLDSSQRYSSIWEKYLILEILYRCLSLPYQLAKHLQVYFLTPMKIYCLVGVGSLFTLVFARLYQTYQQRPERLLYVEKYKPVHPPLLPQSDAWDQLYKKMQIEGARIFLTGKAGCGKTSLIELLLHKQQSDPALQKLSFVHLKIADIATDQSFGHGEILEKIKRKLEPWQDRLVLVIDEAQRLQEHRLLDTFRTKIMDPLPKMRCLFATTSAELPPFTSNDPFARRVHLISVKEPVKEELLPLLRSFIERSYPDWPIPEELLNSVVTTVLTETQDSPPQIGALARAIQLLRERMNTYEQSLQPDYQCQTLRNLKRSLENAERLLLQYTLQGIKQEGDIEAIQTLRNQVAEETRKNAERQSNAQKIVHLHQARRKARERSAFLTQQLIANSRQEAARKELLFLDFVVLPELSKKITGLAIDTLALPKRVKP